MATVKLSTPTTALTPATASARPAGPDQIPCFLPHDEAFAQKAEIYTLEHRTTPLAIVCPRNAFEVAAAVRHALINKIPFTIRVGGHDLWARSMADGALCIDLRGLDGVSVAQDRKTATFGGGVLGSKVMDGLAQHGLVTPCPSACPSIGYVGWATMGGWGSFNDQFGYGADQIVGATLVNADGELVAADEPMLKGIRGGGAGNFGVVVDITVKTYEADKMLAGTIVLDSSKGLGETFADFASGIQRLRDEDKISSNIGIEPFVAAMPGTEPLVGVSFMHSSADLEFGRAALEKVLGVVPVVANSVKEVSVTDWASSSIAGEALAYGQWGSNLAVNVTSWSPRVLDVVNKAAAAMPADSGAAIYVHSLGADSPSVKGSLEKKSCLNPELRQPHYMIQLVGNTLNEAKRGEVASWAQESYRALRGCDEALGAAQPSLLDVEHQTPENVFGSGLDGMRELKTAYDPESVFERAVPRVW